MSNHKRNQEQFFKEKKRAALNTAYANERKNPNMTLSQHQIIAYLTKFQNELTGESEAMYYKGSPRLLVRDVYHENHLEYPKEVAHYFDLFVKAKKAAREAEHTPDFDPLFSSYEVARDQLNVTIKEYLARIDAQYRTNYLRIAKYGEFKGAANSYKDQRGNALEYYAFLKVTRPALTELQHDFVAILAYYRHELHCHGTEFLMQTDNGRKTMSALLSAIDLDTFDRYGFHLPTPLQMAYESLLESREQTAYATGSPYFEEYVDDYLDKKEWFNSEVEKFLSNVDEKAGTAYAPKCDHRLDAVLAREKDKQKIMAAIDKIPKEPPKLKPLKDIPQQPRIDAYTIRSFRAMYVATVTQPLRVVGERTDFIDTTSELNYIKGTRKGTYEAILQASNVKIPVMKVGDDFFINPETITNVYDKDSFLRYDYHTDYQLIKLPRDALQNGIVKVYGSSGRQLNFGNNNKTLPTRKEKENCAETEGLADQKKHHRSHHR